MVYQDGNLKIKKDEKVAEILHLFISKRQNQPTAQTSISPLPSAAVALRRMKNYRIWTI